MPIRKEEPGDRDKVFAVNTAAFVTDAEARLVDALREQADPVISLIAEDQDEIIGHIMFSPVTIAGHPELKIMGLAPMAVLPVHQRAGIGTLLVKEGLDQCRKSGCGAVVVLGHPGYYPRFGFSPAHQFDIDCEYEVPREAFMVLELTEGYLDGIDGTVKYHEAFDNVT